VTIYRVNTYARKRGAIGSHGTEKRTYTVQANTIEEARMLAIDCAYCDTSWDVEHVMPKAVKELSDAEALAEGWR
jgi:hypothetical protein